MKYYGLYKITNLVNGKMYIGQHITSNLDDGYMGSGKIIRMALQKYGKNNFKKEWLGFYEDADELNYMELVFVDETWVSRADTYNISLGGGGHKCKGNKWTLEQRKHMSKRVSGSNNHNYGSHHTQEEKNHISKMMKGKHNALGCKRSDEFKQKLGLRMKGKKYTLGRKHTEKEKAGISAGNIGKKFWNNGVVSVKARECPEGFVAGRLTTRNRTI